MPMASTPGFHTPGSTVTVETVWAGCCMLAKKSLMACDRNRLKPTRPPTTITRNIIASIRRLIIADALQMAP